MKKTRKGKTIGELNRKLEIVFNQWIRRRDCPDGYGNCIACGVQKPREEFHAGHYWSKGAYPALRFDERNVHVECVGCNLFKHGNIGEYAIGLLAKLGAEECEKLSSMRKYPAKRTRADLEELIERYTTLLKVG